MALNVIREMLDITQRLNNRGRTTEDQSSQAYDSIKLENAMLDNAIKKRSLLQPTNIQLQQEKMRLDQAKYVTNKLLELCGDPSVSPASREVYTQMVENHMFSLPEQMRRLVLPLAKGTALDPIEKKKANYDRHFPKPNIANPETDGPLAYAQSLFAVEEWNQKREKFLGLSPSPLSKSQGLGEGLWAVKDEVGRVNLVSDEDEQLAEIAKGYGTTTQAILNNGGNWHTGPWTTVKNGAISYRVRPTKNVLTGNTNYEVMQNEEGEPVYGVAETPRSKEVKSRTMPADLSTLFMKIGANNSDDTSQLGMLAKQFNDVAEEEGEAGIATFVETVLSPAYPDWTFRAVTGAGMAQATFSDVKLIGDKTSLIAIPTTRIVELTDANGVKKVLGVDDNTGLCYFYDGRRVGLLEDIAQQLETGALTWQK